MAYTFEDLSQWWAGKSYPIGFLTLVITQEDGRTDFARGFTNGYDPSRIAFVGQFAQQFNDRTRRLSYGPPSSSYGMYDQNFDMNNGTEPVDFTFRQLGPNAFELQLTLLRWGNTVVTTSLSKSLQAKLYIGWGATIAAGAGQALYAISINDAIETPG